MNGPRPDKGGGRASSPPSNGFPGSCYDSPNSSVRYRNDENSLMMSSSSPTSVAALFDMQPKHHHPSLYTDPCIPFESPFSVTTAGSESPVPTGTKSDVMMDHEKQSLSEMKALKGNLKQPPLSSQSMLPGAHYGLPNGSTNAVPRKPVFIDISPGVRARLRGFQETKACIERDFFLPALCYCCTLSLFCIMDANYVVCPACRVVSPLDGGADLAYDGGVGLGFTFDDLTTWQAEFRGNSVNNRNLVSRGDMD